VPRGGAAAPHLEPGHPGRAPRDAPAFLGGAPILRARILPHQALRAELAAAERQLAATRADAPGAAALRQLLAEARAHAADLDAQLSRALAERRVSNEALEAARRQHAEAELAAARRQEAAEVRVAAAEARLDAADRRAAAAEARAEARAEAVEARTTLPTGFGDPPAEAPLPPAWGAGGAQARARWGEVGS